MNSQQFLSGYNYYQCCIMRTFTQDPVRIVNHPIIQQRFTIFDRMALAGMQRCPFTMGHLIKNELALVSIKLEMLVCIIAAVDACDNELRDDNKITEPQRNEIKEFLRTMSNTCSYEVQQASQNLLHLKNNKNRHIWFSFLNLASLKYTIYICSTLKFIYTVYRLVIMLYIYIGSIC